MQEEFPGTEETKEDMDDAIDPMLAQNQGYDDSVPDEDLPMTYVESGDMDLVNFFILQEFTRVGDDETSSLASKTYVVLEVLDNLSFPARRGQR